MGWWPFSSSPKQDSPPTRTERQICWDSRDAYYACLDGVGVIRAGTEAPSACKAERKAYEGSCAQSWVKYFNERRRIAFAQKDMIAQANAQNAAATGKTTQ
uniref:Uncharacterized protein n=1 Tax=Mycena chlorophos TaxID=658473 RepID=A0ABQ0LVG2_MYCCL|nr:predicted protein [Mycena chlorophos]